MIPPVPTRFSRKNGFSLVELLAVVGVIAVLAALLFPALTRVIEHGQATKCAGNLRQISLAIQSYAMENDTAVVPWRRTNGPSQYWVALLAPYLGNDYAFASGKWPIDKQSVFMCPTVKANSKGETEATLALMTPSVKFRYGINVHIAENGPVVNGTQPNGATFRKTRFNQLMPSLTYIVMDYFGSGQAGYWAPGADDLMYPHSSRVNVLYLDGHVEALDKVRMMYLGQNPYHVFWRGYDWGYNGFRED